MVVVDTAALRLDIALIVMSHLSSANIPELLTADNRFNGNAEAVIVVAKLMLDFG
jgi:hypothetical protein